MASFRFAEALPFDSNGINEEKIAPPSPASIEVVSDKADGKLTVGDEIRLTLGPEATDISVR